MRKNISNIVIASLLGITPALAHAAEVQEIDCQFPGIQLEKEKLLSAIGLSTDADIEISENYRCRMVTRNHNDPPEQVFSDKESVGLRAVPGEFTNELHAYVQNRELRQHVKFVHILYVHDASPKMLLTYRAYPGTGWRGSTRHIYGDQSEFRGCPKTIDYVVAVEFQKDAGIPNLARTYRVKNMPVACESD